MRRTTVLLVLLALLAGLAGCGGSGSSGFDIAPLAENAVIDEVRSTGHCGESGSLVICSARDAAQENPGTPQPTPEPGPQVEVDSPAGPTDSLSCRDAAAQDCALALEFSSSGLPGGAAYRVAARSLHPTGTWIVSEPVDPLTASLFAVVVDLPGHPTAVQVAVLVFTAGDDAVAGPVEFLADTGASFAFVSGTLSLDVP